MEIRDKLPLHPSGRANSTKTHACRVDGLVKYSLNLTLTDLENFPQQELTHDFTCVEGWTVPDLHWSGVLLQTVLLRAEPSPEAIYVQASAGEFSICLPRDASVQAFLAIHLDGAAIPPEHGGPVRLIVPGGDCFMNIKWLDHLELRREPGPNTAKTIALQRSDSVKEER